MQSSHAAAAVSSAFDDPNLIAYGGLEPVVRLAERCGLPALVKEYVGLPASKEGTGAFPAVKVMSLVGGMAAGADSIDDMHRLRHGAMGRLVVHRFGNAADHPERVRRYPSDMTDAEWVRVRPLLPVPGWMRGRGGRPEAYCHRAILDAIRYLVDNGIKWRAMPADFPPWDRVYAFFRRWRDHGLVREFHDRLRGQVRETLGRDAAAGVIDSQSVKADAVVGSDSRGFDGGKLVNGRKRHVVVDTLGLLLGVMVTAADAGDRTAARVLLGQVADVHHRLELVWADGGYTGSLVEHCLAAFALVLAIVKRSDDMRGFVVLPKRWIVERFFAHLMRTRRLVRDFERRTTSAEAMIYWSMTLLMTRRLARPAPGPG